MTRDEIAQLANDTAGKHWGTEEHFQRFAARIAAHERQACAMVVEINAMACNEGILKKVLNANADAIRARGKE